MAARPAALMQRFFGAALVPVAFAHRIFRAFARALISLRRCAGDRRRFAGLAGAGVSAAVADLRPIAVEARRRGLITERELSAMKERKDARKIVATLLP
jgi:hypothetical protein